MPLFLIYFVNVVYDCVKYDLMINLHLDLKNYLYKTLLPLEMIAMINVYSKKQHSVCVGDNEVHRYAFTKLKKKKIVQTIYQLINRPFTIKQKSLENIDSSCPLSSF